MIHLTLLPFGQVPQLSRTDTAYATGETALRPFFRHLPQADAFQAVAAARTAYPTPRLELVEALRRQYQGLPEHAAVAANVEQLLDVHTFTVCTAHQPSLLLGPLYFIYKAVTTINLAKAAQEALGTGRRVVPVFVLGSEDHDLEELNHARLFGKTLTWQPGLGGPVGLMPTASLLPVLEELKGILGDSNAAQALFDRVHRACTTPDSFAGATRALLHEFLGRFGLVVADLYDPALKQTFIPVAEAELTQQAAFHTVNATISSLQTAGFKPQAPPREINLFYLQPGVRERIVLENGHYRVLNTERTFSKEDLLRELHQHPERFSPNVVLRPLYQEMVLPNLAYVGGGGELAYWLERLNLFDHFQTPYPMLVRRNSVLWIDKEASKKRRKAGFEPAKLFQDTDSLIRDWLAANAGAELSLQAEREHLRALFDHLSQRAAAIDPTLEKAVRADESRTATTLDQWENRLVKAEKQKHEVVLNQLRGLKEKLFPGNNLQERADNFLPYALKYGEAFFDELVAHLDPFGQGFVVLEETD